MRMSNPEGLALGLPHMWHARSFGLQVVCMTWPVHVQGEGCCAADTHDC